MLISIVIPAFNEEKSLKHTVEHIRCAINDNSYRGYSWELIVCDNNTTDKTADIATELGCRVVFESERQISRARNSGASIANGHWLLFIDADTYPRPELLAETIDVIESGTHIGCGTTIEVVGGTLFNKLRMESMNPISRLFNLSGGAFLLCQCNAFRSIGGFSTNLYAYEEIDFLFRLKWHGWKIGKKFKVLHHYPVITSGRRADYNVISIMLVIASNFLAVILFVLHYLLPKSLVKKLGERALGYWYATRQ